MLLATLWIQLLGLLLLLSFILLFKKAFAGFQMADKTG